MMGIDENSDSVWLHCIFYAVLVLILYAEQFKGALIIVSTSIDSIFFSFLDAIASLSSYPCQSVSE